MPVFAQCGLRELGGQFSVDFSWFCTDSQTLLFQDFCVFFLKLKDIEGAASVGLYDMVETSPLLHNS